MAERPRIAEVKCSGMEFRPGQRILVRTFCHLTSEEARRLRSTIEKWAGSGVEVLILDGNRFDLTVEDGRAVKLP